MRRLVVIFAALILVMATASSAGAAPKPPPDNNKNHPAFPQFCDQGPGTPFIAWAVLNNGGSKGALPIAVAYIGGTFTEPPDFATADTIKGISMYRTTTVTADGGSTLVSFVGQSRGTGNGKKGTSDVAEVFAEIAQVEAKWVTTRCTVAIPGFILNQVYPADPPLYVDEYSYQFTNWLRSPGLK